MTQENTLQSTIVRTERGLSIAGTRITLYDVMDYLVFAEIASKPPAPGQEAIRAEIKRTRKTIAPADST